MINKILAVILAGGDSSRFWPLEQKSFFPIFGKPLLYYCLSRLKKEGINDFLIVYSDKNASLLNEFITSYPQFHIEKVVQKDPRGMAGAVLSAAELISGRKVFIVGSEEVYEDSLVHNLIKNIQNDTQSLIVGYEVRDYVPGGYLTVEKGLIKRIIEKPARDKAPSNTVSIVFHYYNDPKVLLNYLRKIKSKKDDIYEKALDQMMKDGYRFNLFPYKGFWGYLKYPWHVLDTVNYFLDGVRGQNIAKSAKIDTRATIKGPVFIGEDVRILEYAKIVGPTYIGDRTIVGNNVMVRKSMIGANCVIGFASEIGRSYVGDNCWFHTNYIGDSIIADNVSMGAGAILANLRLDETPIKSSINEKIIQTNKNKLGGIVGSNVRIGVNSSIMPGVKIGKNSFVGAGVVLDSDLDQGKFCFVKKQNYMIKNNKFSVSDSFRREAGRKLRSP